jgi:hypothetical protein
MSIIVRLIRYRCIRCGFEERLVIVSDCICTDKYVVALYQDSSGGYSLNLLRILIEVMMLIPHVARLILRIVP